MAGAAQGGAVAGALAAMGMADNNAGGSPIRFRRKAPARRTCKGLSRLSLSGPDADTSALRQRMEAQMGLMEDALRQLKEDVGTMGLLADRPDATGRGDEPSQGDGVAREARAAEPGDDSECAVASDAGSSEEWDVCEWPQTVAMRPCFEEALAELDIGNSRATTTKDFLQRARFRIKTRENDLVTKQHFTSRFILYPHCRRVLIFKAFSIVVLVFDLCMVPYMIAWDSPYEGWTFAHMLFSALFWFLDMISNFMIGYVRDYQVQMRPMDIVVHYVRTRFLLDLLFVCSDVVSLVVLGGAGAADAYWLFSALRALKAGRLMQIRNLLNACSQIITDEKYHSLMIFAVIIAGALWLNHIMACAWHAIGTRAHADTGMYWTATIDLEYTESGEIYQYLTSLHWSVATFLGGNFEMYCRNSIERAVSIGYTMAGLVYGSILISLLSAALVDRNEARKLQTQRLVTLRRYLRERKIDQSIAVLVQQQITERLGKKEALSEKEVDSLGYLSKALRYELKLDMFRRHITTHPLFDLWAAIDKRALQSLCAETLDFQNILAKDDLFTVGAKAVAAYYVVKGLFHYAADATALASPSVVRKKTSLTMSSVEFDEAMGIESGAWLAEACLWVDWSHAGTAEAVQASQVLTVNGEGVCRAMAAHPHVRDITVQYCTLFHKAVTQARPPEDYPDDLRVPRAEFSSLVLRMDRDIQVTVGLHAIAKMKVNAGVGRFMILTGKDDKLDTLKNEVESGKSTLLVSATGEVERFVSLVAVRLVNKEKQLLVQLAKQENQQESIKADCALPAQKKPSGVSVEESLDRILADKLSQFTGGADAKTVVHDIPQPDVRIEESKLFGIKTKYLRYVCTVLVVETSHSPASRAATVRSTGTTDAIAAPLAVGRRGSRGSFGAQSEPGEDPLANGVEDGGVLRGLLDRNVHPVEADGKITWYAWVSEDEFAFLRRTEAKPLLLRWLASCSPSQAERPFDRDVSDVGSGVISPRTLAQRMMSPWHQAQAADQSPRGVGHTPAGASSAQTGASVPEGTTRGDGSHTTTPRHAPVHPSETRQAGSEEVTSEMSLAEEFHQEGHRPQAVL